ncbi:MAG TPA: tetratricopeptide repeat protein [candidate division Zixibacteria bacterium]|nr:tetratricopeptide repeat protein [candidate division Zixibacteria bacterium]HEQ98472.1 tetratricopeptide repeat protein [candidate division Zixibacteria bacterium]
MKLNRLLFVSAILIFLILAASLLKPGFLWGLKLPGYLDLYQSFLIILSALSIYILISLAAGVPGMEQDTSDVKLKRIAILLFSAIFLVIIFYQFRSATMLLGDGYLRANETNLGSKLHFTEPLDKFWQYIVYITLGDWFGLKSYQTYQIVSIFGGVLFFMFGLWFADRYGKSRPEKILMAALIFSSAIMQIFFGYVESYSLSNPLFLFAIGATYVEVKHSRSIIPGLLLYFTACLFHMSLLAYYPAFFILAIILWRAERSGNSLAEFIAAIAVPILSITMVIVLNNLQFGGSFDQNIFDYLIIPLLPNDTGYWLLSPTHLLDMLNQILLVAPAAIIIFIAFNPFRRKFYTDHFSFFVALLSICGLLFLAFFDTAFGIARDWDLFSSIAIPLNVLAGVMLINAHRASEDYSSFKKFSPVLPALIISFAFILLNSQEKPSVERYKDIINQSEHGRHLNLENLGNYYSMEDDTVNYYDVLRKAGKYVEHPRYQHKIGMKLLEDGLTERAVEHFYKALQIDPSYLPALNYLGMTYGLIGEKEPEAFTIAEKYFRLVQRYDPDYPHLHHNLGGIYYQSRRYDQALSEYRMAIEADPDHLPSYEKLGMTFERTGQYDSSEYYYRYVIEHDREGFDAYLHLGKMLYSSGKKETASQVLSSAEENFPDSEKQIEIAKTYAQINLYSDAVRVLEELTQNPASPVDAYVTLANLYNLLNKQVQGISVLSRAAERNADPRSLIALAETFLQLGASDSAEVHLLNSISLDQTFYLGYRKLGTYYLLQGMQEKARQVLEMGLANVENPRDRKSLSSLLDRINDQ